MGAGQCGRLGKREGMVASIEDSDDEEFCCQFANGEKKENELTCGAHAFRDEFSRIRNRNGS